ncbi:DUF58 domain-containing protein [Ferrimonas lipolytica]|uniref:DUF58 domain-containing protein n=1 Tax=Ferrimonas lipolytica TaxID=2724191 RepID=A0A6H1UBS0_9GAMM|nr:DUF58 domain-containing protein [Ferrimonas lipolytica]QIZ76537.1 DUF58 domain-containing protein [Ferrimonas lipolytica]
MSSSIHVDMPQLQQLKFQAQGLSFVSKRKIKRQPLGQHRSSLHGRGLNFEELRQYQHGDDIRTMDWKATLRTSKPHVRVFSEERDRDLLIVLDQRQAMFFGSTGKTKSVIAAELAALSMWIATQQGDRTGLLVFSDSSSRQLQPKRNQRHQTQLLQQITAYNQSLSVAPLTHQAAPTASHLHQVLAQCNGASLVLLICDPNDWDDDTFAALKLLLQQHQVVLCHVADPLEQQLPADANLILSNGLEQIQVDGNDSALTTKMAQHQHHAEQRFEALEQRYPFQRFMVSTIKPITAQLRTWLESR